MSYKKSVDITIEQFFIDRKKEIIDTYNNNLLEELMAVKCNKFAIVNKFSDIMNSICNTYYNNLLESYETNKIVAIDPSIIYIFMIENFLRTIESYFETEEEFENSKSNIKEIIKDFNCSLISLYNVTSENLIPSTTDSRKIS